MFDAQKDCAGIPWLIAQAVNRREEFSHRTDADLNETIVEAQHTLVRLAPVLSALKGRRDRWLAHIDKRSIRDPEQFERDVRLTYPELEAVFASANEILNRMADFHGQAGYLVFSDDYDDLPNTLDLIEKGVRANAQE